MQIYVNLDTGKLQRTAANSTPLSQVDFKRGDDTRVEIIFVRNNVPEELAAGSVVTFCAKLQGEYDGDAIVFEDGFSLEGSGAAAKYVAYPSFNTSALDEVLMVDDDATNDLARIDLMAEISRTDGPAGPVSSSGTFTSRVYNDVHKGDEIAPTELPTPDDWLESRRPSPLLLTAPPEDGVTPGALGQLAIVTTTNSLSGSPITHRDVWHYTATNTWTPPGHITRDRDDAILRRIYTSAGGPETELAYP